jgi:hypothetical protein
LVYLDKPGFFHHSPANRIANWPALNVAWLVITADPLFYELRKRAGGTVTNVIIGVILIYLCASTAFFYIGSLTSNRGSSGVASTSVSFTTGTSETNPGQTGFSLSSSFNWGLSSPEFYVSSAWQTWNQHSGSWYAFQGYADVQSNGTNTNNIGTAFQSSPGVNIKIGQSATDGQQKFWCISGSCPPRPPP